MPYKSEWCEPERVLGYKGISIYRTYLNEDAARPSKYVYSCDLKENLDTFDIRDLTTYNDKISHQEVLRRAIDIGEINTKKPEIPLFMGIQLQFSELIPKANVIQMLEEDPRDITVTLLREKYVQVLGIDPVWRYPIYDGTHYGTVIIPVQEGFLCVPYDTVVEDDYEIYEHGKIYMLEADIAEEMTKELESYSMAFCKALSDMRTLLEKANVAN